MPQVELLRRTRASARSARLTYLVFLAAARTLRAWAIVRSRSAFRSSPLSLGFLATAHYPSGDVGDCAADSGVGVRLDPDPSGGWADSGDQRLGATDDAVSEKTQHESFGDELTDHL